jgi:plastocyanin
MTFLDVGAGPGAMVPPAREGLLSGFGLPKPCCGVTRIPEATGVPSKERGSGRVNRHAALVCLVSLTALFAVSVAAVPMVRAATPSTFHVTLGTANGDMSLMGMAFYPSAFTVHQGDVLVFTNLLPEPHTVTFGATGPLDPFAFFAPQNLTGPGTGTFTGAGILNSGILVPHGPFGNSITITIAVGPGTYVFQCAFHPLMTGTVTVVPDRQALPKTDAQYQHQAHAQMTVDIAHARDFEEASILAAATSADLGGTGIEVAIGGGNGVSTVMRFFPSNLTIHVGDTVTWVNQDPFTPHTVTFGLEPPGGLPGLVPPANRTFPFGAPTAYDGSFNLNSGFLLAMFPWGNRFSVTFTAPGTYPYICGLHDTMGMVGEVTVTS